MRSKLTKPSTSRSNGYFANSSKQSNNEIQAKLKANKPGDKYEVEADKMADQVVDQSIGNVLGGKSSTPGVDFGKPLPLTIRPEVRSSTQRKEEDVQAKEREDERETEDMDLQMKESEVATMGMSDSDLGEEDPILAQSIQMKKVDVQMKASETTEQGMSDRDLGEEDPIRAQALQMKKKDVEAQTKETGKSKKKSEKLPMSQNLRDSKGFGVPLPKGLKTEMEGGFGVDFTDVRVHTDARSESMNQELGAQAFTDKKDIYFNQSKFNPESKEGKLLIAHELSHTIQQGAVAPKNGKGGTNTNSKNNRSSTTDASASTSSASTELIELEKSDEIAD